MTLPDPGDPREGAADITLVEVRCEGCGETWEEFRTTAEGLYRRSGDARPATRYISAAKDCIYCNATPGDYIRGGKWRKPSP